MGNRVGVTVPVEIAECRCDSQGEAVGPPAGASDVYFFAVEPDGTAGVLELQRLQVIEA